MICHRSSLRRQSYDFAADFNRVLLHLDILNTLLNILSWQPTFTNETFELLMKSCATWFVIPEYTWTSLYRTRITQTSAYIEVGLNEGGKSIVFIKYGYIELLNYQANSVALMCHNPSLYWIFKVISSHFPCLLTQAEVIITTVTRPKASQSAKQSSCPKTTFVKVG